jgi:HEAT repeat protein
VGRLAAENEDVMEDSMVLPWPMALAIILAFVSLALYFTRAYARRLRRRIRQEARELARDFTLYIDEKISAVDLREAVHDADPGSFWGALEPLAFKLPRAEWIRLSRALDGNRHSREERRALRDDSPWRAELGTRRLALLASPRSRKSLRRALARGPEFVSYSAARALARYNDRRALEWLLQHPEALKRRSTRQWTNLLRLFGNGAYEPLVAGLDTCNDNPTLERALVEALGYIGDLAAASRIERRLSHSDMNMRAAAARSLGRMRAIHCATSLLKALKDEDWQVRAQAAWALGRSRAPIAVYSLTTKVTDRSWWVRRHSAYALAELGDEGRQALLHLSEHSSDPYARDMAHEALSGNAEQRAA